MPEAVTKRYFVCVTDFTGVFVRYNGEFEDLEEAMRCAKVHANLWRGIWSVSDTTKWVGKYWKTIAFGKTEAFV